MKKLKTLEYLAFSSWTKAVVVVCISLASISFPLFDTPPAFATSFAPQPFESVVEETPQVVRGTTGSSYTQWVSEEGGGRRIYTFTEVTPKEVLKGSTPKTSFMIRELGGEKDGIGLHVPGTAQFSKGEDVVIFLHDKNSDGSFSVSGMMMGKLNVETDPNTGEDKLVGPVLLTEGNLETQKWTLTALRDLIRKQEAKKSPSPTLSVTPKPSESLRPFQNTRPGAPASPASFESSAPQLQQNSDENPKNFWVFSFLVGMIWIVGAVCAFIYFYLFKDKNKK